MAARFTRDGVHPLDNSYVVTVSVAHHPIDQALGDEK